MLLTETFFFFCAQFIVKGLEILATFPGSFISASKFMYEKILLTLMSIIESDFNKTFLWKAALKVLVEISLFVNKYDEDVKAASFNSIVMQKIVSLISSGDLNMLPSLKLEAIFDIGMTRKSFMLTAASQLEKTISANLSEIFVRVLFETSRPLLIHRMLHLFNSGHSEATLQEMSCASLCYS